MDMKKAALALAGLAVGFVVGYGTGRVSTGTPINPLTGAKGGYEEGYAAAMQKMADAGLIPPEPNEAFSLSGKIASIEGDAIVFDANAASLNPLAPAFAPSRRTARITASTKIEQAVPTTDEETVAAQEAFEAALAAGEPATPPEPLKRVAYAQPLKAGDMIVVQSESNILEAASFDAAAILVANAP